MHDMINSKRKERDLLIIFNFMATFNNNKKNKSDLFKLLTLIIIPQASFYAMRYLLLFISKEIIFVGPFLLNAISSFVGIIIGFKLLMFLSGQKANILEKKDGSRFKFGDFVFVILFSVFISSVFYGLSLLFFSTQIVSIGFLTGIIIGVNLITWEK